MKRDQFQKVSERYQHYNTFDKISKGRGRRATSGLMYSRDERRLELISCFSDTHVGLGKGSGCSKELLFLRIPFLGCLFKFSMMLIFSMMMMMFELFYV